MKSSSKSNKKFFKKFLERARNVFAICLDNDLQMIFLDEPRKMQMVKEISNRSARVVTDNFTACAFSHCKMFFESMIKLVDEVSDDEVDDLIEAFFASMILSVMKHTWKEYLEWITMRALKEAGFEPVDSKTAMINTLKALDKTLDDNNGGGMYV